MKKIISLFSLIIFGVLGCTALYASPVFAKNDTHSNVCSSSAPESVKKAAGCNVSGNDDLPRFITEIISQIILIAGLIAVIFIIIGGVKYMTSSGDAGKLKSARDTIIYSLIGLIVCALAFAIVNFVILNILKNTGSDPAEQTPQNSLLTSNDSTI